MLPLIDHNGFTNMCGYQPSCICNFTVSRGYYLDQCPDYCDCYNPKKKPIKSEDMPILEIVNEIDEDEGQTTLDIF